MPKKVIIMGAAGKDFHVFNTCFRNNPEYKVVAFTATQIPNIEDRRYPPSLAGSLYPEGIPIYSERLLSKLIKEHQVELVIFSYSDVSYDYMKRREKVVREAGADFQTFDIEKTTLQTTKPVIAVCAVRTGSGKSPATRKVVKILKEIGKKVAIVRHPMPYGDLEKQKVQRFETLEDLERHHCTIEEMEEYEPHLRMGTPVFAGIDYQEILREVEKEFEIIVWDGGNNDLPFFKPVLHITVADPIRAGHELNYFPGRINFEKADVLLINKVNTASAENVEKVIKNAQKLNPDAVVIKTACVIYVDKPEEISGKRVLVIEDGPSVTHGETSYGAAYVAAKQYGALEIVDPRKYVVGSICKVYQDYPHIDRVLPAMGYGSKQIKELEESINNTDCDIVLVGTPIDLIRILKINKPAIRVRYEIEEIEPGKLREVILQKVNLQR